MRTLEYLTGPASSMFWPGVLAGLAIALQGAVLSVLVVLKRMAFIGQGVSHAAFGGIGLAAFLGVSSGLWFPLVGLFCVVSAWVIAWGSGRKEGRTRAGSSPDTVIGVALVGAMALGAILLALRAKRGGGGTAPGWEQVLFGSILAVTPWDAWVAAGSCAVTAAAVWWVRRPILNWAFDETTAEASGAPTGSMRMVLLTLLAVAIVTAMKLAGVVLATALLVLPGAAALRIASRMGGVLLWSGVIGVMGMAGGMVVSFESDLPPGACVVGALVLMYGVASVVGHRGSAMVSGGLKGEKAA